MYEMVREKIKVARGKEEEKMIKKIRMIFKKYMIRPMLYQSVTKFAVALVLCLLWDRFLNQDGYRSMAESALFVAGCVFLMLAWIQYLRLDGVRVHHLLEEKQEKKQKHITKDMVDFVDEKIIPFGELDDEEQIVCRFLGDLLCASACLFPSLIAMVL